MTNILAFFEIRSTGMKKVLFGWKT